MGKADDAVAVGLHGCIASAITLERCAVPVEFPAVRLDHQLSIRPEGVNLAAENRGPGDRDREPMLAAELEDSVLQRRLSVLGNSHGIDKTSDRTQCTASRTPRADGLELRHVEEAEPISLLGRSPEAVLIAHFGEVEERACDRSHRNSAHGRTIGGIYAPTVNQNSRSRPCTSDRNLHRPTSWARESPQGRRVVVAEQGAGLKAEHGGQPTTSDGEDLVTDCVHAVMQTMKPTHLDPAFNRPVTQAQSTQLTAGNHAVLASRKRRDRPLPGPSVTIPTHAVG